MKGPDAGPETGAPEWSRPQRASEPLPPPPSGYKFAGPDYLYAPRQEEEAPAAPAPTEAAATTSAPASAPAMVWSEARSTWEPAAPLAPAPPPLVLPPVQPKPLRSPPRLAPNWSVPRPRRRFKARRVITTVVVGLFVVNCFAAGMHSMFSDNGPLPTLAEPITAPTATPSLVAPPSPNVPVPTAPYAVPTRLADLLGTQIAGARIGDESWFLSTVDPNAKAALDTYKRIFANVQALRAQGFSESVENAGDGTASKATSRVSIDFCIGGNTVPCALASADLDVQIAPHGSGVAIEAVTPAVETSLKSAPWLATALTVTAYGNVLVAATPTTNAEVAKVLPVAEVAASDSDRYSPNGPPPYPYVVYLASHTDLMSWFGTLDQISYGVVDATIGNNQVVVALPDATLTGPKGGDGLAANLQRALADMALTTNDDTPATIDTLSTGLREYAAYQGLDHADADTMAPFAAYIHSSDWNHSCYYSSPTASSAGMNAMPAVGLAAFRFLADRHGFYYAFSFWNAVERLGESRENASQEMFHMPWTKVDSECAGYLIKTAGP